MDADTENLILQLQIQDLTDSMQRLGANSENDNTTSDQECAIRLQLQKFEAQEVRMADTRMARSIGAAVAGDARVILNHLSVEQSAVRDGALARQMGGRPADIARGPRSEPVLNDAELHRLQPWNRGQLGRPAEILPEPTSWESECGKNEPVEEKECISCSEVRVGLEVPCGHHYCYECLIVVASNAVKDGRFFPPRCCKTEMPLQTIRSWIGEDLTADLEHKAIELSTEHRIYCHHCGKFILPGRIEKNRARCQTCSHDTCSLCREEFHDGRCPEDPELQKTIEVAVKEGWQACCGCNNLVERTAACNHMEQVKSV